MKVGDLVRVSSKSDFFDKRWAGALAIVLETIDRNGFVRLRRLADGKTNSIARRAIELPEDQNDESR